MNSLLSTVRANLIVIVYFTDVPTDTIIFLICTVKTVSRVRI